jgi:hypothetical protein
LWSGQCGLEDDVAWRMKPAWCGLGGVAWVVWPGWCGLGGVA